MTTAAGLMSLDDLRRTYRATQTISEPRTPSALALAATRWAPMPGEQVLLVCGCGGSVGTTTVALALATVAGRARVVETCGAASSGLAYAATAELGPVEPGWLRGTRDTVHVERRIDPIASPDRVPAPAHSDLAVTIVDSSWDLATVLASTGWLGELARSAPTIVLVARATIPGLRRLDAALGLVGETRAIAVTVGAKRWPRPVEQSAGAAVRRLAALGRVICVPELPALAISGLTPDPLPPAITRPAQALLSFLEGHQE